MKVKTTLIDTPLFYIKKKSKFQQKDYALHFKGILSGLSIGPIATNEKGKWIIASLHHPWSLTWRWFLSIRFIPKRYKRPLFYFLHHVSPRGSREIYFNLYCFRLAFKSQRNMKITDSGDIDFDNDGRFCGIIDTIFTDGRTMYITVSSKINDDYYSLSIPYDRKTNAGDEICRHKLYVYIGEKERPIKILSKPVRIPTE